MVVAHYSYILSPSVWIVLWTFCSDDVLECSCVVVFCLVLSLNKKTKTFFGVLVFDCIDYRAGFKTDGVVSAGHFCWAWWTVQLWRQSELPWGWACTFLPRKLWFLWCLVSILSRRVHSLPVIRVFLSHCKKTTIQPPPKNKQKLTFIHASCLTIDLLLLTYLLKSV